MLQVVSQLIGTFIQLSVSQPLPVEFRSEDGLLHYVGDYSKRPRDPGADVEQCFAGNITVSLIRI